MKKIISIIHSFIGKTKLLSVIYSSIYKARIYAYVGVETKINMEVISRKDGAPLVRIYIFILKYKNVHLCFNVLSRISRKATNSR